METPRPKTLPYRRSHFATQLPVDFRYSPAHVWLGARGDDLWRVGYTKFATRMLGEMVDHGFETPPGAVVACGQIIGWVEGFKAISDLFCAADGEFAGGNPALKENIQLLSDDPYGAGWLYEIKGRPDPKCVEVHAYKELLDQTIDRIMEKQKGDEIQ